MGVHYKSPGLYLTCIMPTRAHGCALCCLLLSAEPLHPVPEPCPTPACSEETAKKHLLVVTMNHAGADANSGFRILQTLFAHWGNLSAGTHAGSAPDITSPSERPVMRHHDMQHADEACITAASWHAHFRRVRTGLI